MVNQRSSVLAAIVVLAITLALSIGAWAGEVARERATEAAAYRTVYMAALLSHHDPDAAVRKARWTTDAMVENFSMARGQAAAEVARFLILRGGGLCQGGLLTVATR
jgi:hypothetical protein